MATNNVINTATGASGTILQGAGVGSASTFSTATYPSTTTINQVLYSSATNTIAGISTAIDGVMITSHTGIPSILANGTAGYLLTANSGAPPSWQVAPAGGIATIGSSTDKSIVTWSGTGGTTVQNNANLVTTANGEILGGVGAAATCTFSFNSHVNYGIFYTTNTLNLSANGTAWFTIGSGGTCTAASGLTASGLLNSSAGRQCALTSSSSTNLNMSSSNHFILLTSSAARAVVLPSNGQQGQIFVIKDQSGAASTGNITITVNGGTKTIDGSTSLVLSTNYAVSRVVYDGTNFSTW